MKDRVARLIEPSPAYQDGFLAAMREEQAMGEITVTRLDAMAADFGAYLEQLRGQRLANDERVPQWTFWLVAGGDYLGTIKIRSALNPRLRIIGGHIGYSVAPGHRRRGHGKAMLALGLERARDLGLTRVLLTCDEDNDGSRLVIERNGGVCEGCFTLADWPKPILRYWIDLGPGAARAPNSTVVLRASDPTWAQRYHHEAALLTQVLGDGLVALHHVGSTAVPGLIAKPIVDMLGVVGDLRVLEPFRASLAATGYVWKGECGIAGRRFFTKDELVEPQGGGPRLVHLHVFAAGDPEVETHLRFRDYLLAHPEAVTAYAALKQELKDRYELDRTKYTEAKAPFIQSILHKARSEDGARSGTPPRPNFLEWGRNLQALAQTGIAYTKDPFDRERFQLLRGIAGDMLAALAGVQPSLVEAIFLPEKGYATPKVDVRGAVFQEDKILLVRERADGRWALPGGWADVGMAPAACVEKEVREEAGLIVKATKLLGCLDNLRHGHPPHMLHAYKLMFLCEVVGGVATPGLETSEVGYFTLDELPPLSTPRVTSTQIARLFAHRRQPELFADFD